MNWSLIHLLCKKNLLRHKEKNFFKNATLMTSGKLLDPGPTQQPLDREPTPLIWGRLSSWSVLLLTPFSHPSSFHSPPSSRGNVTIKAFIRAFALSSSVLFLLSPEWKFSHILYRQEKFIL
jgi:hypothetical protein